MLSKEPLMELKEFIASHKHKLYICSELKVAERVTYYYDIKTFIDNNLKPSFNQLLFDFIDKKGVTDVQVYKKAGIDRRHFSKIRSNKNYHPSKRTVILLALALELDKHEVNKLLNSAGFALSENNTFDLVIKFCLDKKIYNIYEINQILEYFNLELLCSEV